MKPRLPTKRWQKVPRHCPFCKKGVEPDYKKSGELAGYISERGKILGAGRTGICPKHQHRLAREIKRARFLCLLPFTLKLNWNWKPNVETA